MSSPKLTLTRAALAGAALALVCAPLGSAHDPKGDIQALVRDLQAKQREVDDLRVEKNTLQDQNIEFARRFDQERLRHMKEKEELQAQLARAGAGGAAPPPEAAASPLDARRVTLNFDATPLAEVLEFLTDLGGARFDAQGVEGAAVTLRVRDIPLRAAISVLLTNARDGAGQYVELEWRAEGDLVRIRPR